MVYNRNKHWSTSVLISTPPFCCLSLILLSSHAMASSVVSEASSTTTRGVNLLPLWSTDCCSIFPSPRAPAPEMTELNAKENGVLLLRGEQRILYFLYLYLVIYISMIIIRQMIFAPKFLQLTMLYAPGWNSQCGYLQPDEG